MRNITWFKEKITPQLRGYEIEYKLYKDGDFGDLQQVEFNSSEKGGEIDFWSSGCLSIYLVDYIKEEVILNVFWEPTQVKEQEESLKKLQELLAF